MLARVAINPIVGGFMALLASAKAVNKVFTQIIANSNTGIFSGTFSRDMDASTKAAVEGEVAWRSFERALSAVAAAGKSVKTNTEEAIAAIRQHGVAVAEQQNAAKAQELAKINMLEETDQMGHPQAIQARLDIEDEYARRKLVANIEAKDAQIEAKRKEVEKLSQGAEHEEQNAAAARKEYEDAQRDLERFQALKSATDKALAETTKQVNALQGANFIGPGQINQLDTARALQAQLRTRAGVLGGQGVDYADAARAAKERYDTSMTRARELRGSATDIGQGIPAEQALANQGYRDAGEVAATERLTRTYKATADVAKEQSQVSGAIDKAVEGMHGVAVSSLIKLQATTQALADLQKRVAGLEAAKDNRHL